MPSTRRRASASSTNSAIVRVVLPSCPPPAPGLAVGPPPRRPAPAARTAGRDKPRDHCIMAHVLGPTFLRAARPIRAGRFFRRGSRAGGLAPPAQRPERDAEGREER